MRVRGSGRELRALWEEDEMFDWAARRLKAGFLQSFHPDWTSEQVEAEVRRNSLYSNS
jgi:hypothetical protein